MRIAVVALVLSLAWLAGCSSEEQPRDAAPSTPAQESPPSSSAPATTPAGRLMPDLVGLPSATAGERLGALGLSSDWGEPVVVRCGRRPRTVARQFPPPGTPVDATTTVRIRTAALDLGSFRGPCAPADAPASSLPEADTALARQFYRFAADPALGASFAPQEVWIGIEDGPTAVSRPASGLDELAAWELGEEYAERSGPFSALDTLALSGGYYDLTAGVTRTCPQGNGEAPPELRGLRAISLTAPDDVTSACSEWWGVTLFLDDQRRIRGVALRLGSP